jgi:glucosyl-dolichyl phosphate glucuronosyltransferase
VSRTLPRGVLRGLRRLARGDRAGGAQAWAIVEGTALTAGSYGLARVKQARRAAAPRFLTTS